MTEAADAVVRLGLDTLALPLITSGFFDENPASGRLLEKLGFEVAGRGTRPCLAQGGDVLSVEMRLKVAASRLARIRGIRFATLARLCAALACRPGDLVDYEYDAGDLAQSDD